MRALNLLGLAVTSLLAAACGDDAAPVGATDEPSTVADITPDAGLAVELEPLGEPILRSDVEPVTSTEGVGRFVSVPPFLDCRDPMPGDSPGKGPDGKVCTNTSIAGCTEPGKYYPDYASCDVVRTQRPFFPGPPENMPAQQDPRLEDPEFMGELAWVTEQARSSACVCCHDSSESGQAAGWDVGLGPIWTDTISDEGLALFTGFADSSTLGAYPAEDNHGFDRDTTGLPTTDIERMRAYFVKELARRGISEADARKVEPFGGPIYRNKTYVPVACKENEGMNELGQIFWDQKNTARYIYVLEAGSANPGVTPNLDLPEGTIWRLDTLATERPLTPGLRYGETPPGTFQSFPANGRAPALTPGKTYFLYAAFDIGLRVAGCLFTYQGE